MRIVIALAGIVALESTALADGYWGAAIGAGTGTIDGHVDHGPQVIDPEPTLAAGLGLLIGQELEGAWGWSVHPSVQKTGSHDFQLTYLTVPVLMDARSQSGRWRLRMSLGAAPAWLTYADKPHDGEQGIEVTSDVRRWSLSAVAAIAVEMEQREQRVRWAFLELRAQRGLFAVDPDSAPDVFTQDIGLWFGLRSR